MVDLEVEVKGVLRDRVVRSWNEPEEGSTSHFEAGSVLSSPRDHPELARDSVPATVEIHDAVRRS